MSRGPRSRRSRCRPRSRRRDTSTSGRGHARSWYISAATSAIGRIVVDPVTITCCAAERALRAARERHKRRASRVSSTAWFEHDGERAVPPGATLGAVREEAIRVVRGADTEVPLALFRDSRSLQVLCHDRPKIEVGRGRGNRNKAVIELRHAFRAHFVTALVRCADRRRRPGRLRRRVRASAPSRPSRRCPPRLRATPRARRPQPGSIGLTRTTGTQSANMSMRGTPRSRVQSASAPGRRPVHPRRSGSRSRHRLRDLRHRRRRGPVRPS